MPRMSDGELLSLLASAKDDAVTYNGNFTRENEKYLKAYLGEKSGEFAANPDQSSVVSTDIADVVEADMPSLVRVFLGSGDILTFTPNTDNEIESKEAEEKTKYVNWVVRNQPDSFAIIHGWLKDAEIYKNSVVKYFVYEKKEVEQVEYSGVDQDELAAIAESLRGTEVDRVKVSVDVDEQEEIAPNSFDIKFRVTRIEKKICIINIPPESFLITRNASSLEDAELVGDRVRKTRGELLAEGFDRNIIDSLPTQDSDDERNTNLKAIRYREQGGEDQESSIKEWASQYVEISDLYVKIDYDGDGIAERRHIMTSGNKVLVNEYFNHVPYASLSAILMPHNAIGRSRAEITYPTQLQKTAIRRGLNDNIHVVNYPRNIVHGDVDMDDYTSVRPNGAVRLDDNSEILPNQAVFPLTIPYIGDKALQVLQYIDQTRAQTTGALLANQGLDADQISKETATRFNGVKDASDAKIELMARNYAETGFRKLYEGIAWLASRYQDTQTEFRVLGKQMTINPSSWKYNHHIETNVGLGAGNNEKLVESLQGVYAIQQQLKAQGSNLVDDKDIYNTLKRIVDGLGLPRVDEFFNNPEEPESTLKADNEILNRQVLILQEQLQQLQDNPLAEAEAIKQRGNIEIAARKQQLEAAQLIEDKRQFDIEAAQKRSKQQQDAAIKITELELENETDLPGGVQ